MCASAARPDHLQLLDALLGIAGDDDSPFETTIPGSPR